MNTQEQVDENEAKIIEKAAEKLLPYGERVGATAEDMISLFDSGISMRELLVLLVSKGSGAT